jgi:hypothetical protein
MTLLLSSSPICVIDALRGDPTVRPLANTTSASGLRAQLEDGIYEILGQQTPATPIVVRASSLRQNAEATNLSLSTMGRIRGVLITQLLRLHCVGMDINHAYEESLQAWRGDAHGSELLERYAQLDDDERARLETDVTAHAVTLTRTLGTVPGRWFPRCAVRATQRLAGGQVILRDVLDLVIGTNNAETSGVALLDVTTSPLGEETERTLGYHALVETLRTSFAPLRTSAFSTATGDLWSMDVDHELLQRSAEDVLAIIDALWKSR